MRAQHSNLPYYHKSLPYSDESTYHRYYSNPSRTRGHSADIERCCSERSHRPQQTPPPPPKIKQPVPHHSNSSASTITIPVRGEREYASHSGSASRSRSSTENNVHRDTTIVKGSSKDTSVSDKLTKQPQTSKSSSVSGAVVEELAMPYFIPPKSELHATLKRIQSQIDNHDDAHVYFAQTLSDIRKDIEKFDRRIRKLENFVSSKKQQNSQEEHKKDD